VEARAPKVSFAGEEVYAAAEVEVEVERGQTAEVELEYAFAGLDVQDDVGDRTATGGHDYDIVATGYRVVGDHVDLYVTLAEGQTDLSVFIAYFDVDADEDPTTGGLGAYEQFCPSPGHHWAPITSWRSTTSWTRSRSSVPARSPAVSRSRPRYRTARP